MKKVLVLILGLLTVTCVNAEGVSQADMNEMNAVMRCMAYTMDMGLRTDVTPDQAQSMEQKAVQLFKKNYPNLRGFTEYNPTPEQMAIDFAEVYHYQVQDSEYKIEDFNKARNVENVSPNYEEAAASLWNQNNCALLIK
ncbi:hypothetical protein PGN95_08175 [Klebsiella aerogenes]|nr:hypothetical protein [Klebsiella aerogenes]